MWEAKKSGLLVRIPKLGYWLADVPLTEEAKQRAVEARLNRPKRADSRQHQSTGRLIGRKSSITPAQLKMAEDLIIANELTFSEIAERVGIGQPLLHYYFKGGRKALLAKKEAEKNEKPQIETETGGQLKRPLKEQNQMETQTYEFRGYEIQVTHKPPIWQAAIYPTKPGMLEIDWTSKPIEAANVRGAELLARDRINEALESA
jgi:hypothetical protein